MSGNVTGVQAPVQPAPVRPVRGVPPRMGVQRRPQIDFTRWKIEALQRLGLQSKMPAQTTIATGVTTLRAGLFPPAGANSSATLTQTVGHPAEALFDTYLQALAAFEQAPIKNDAARQTVKAAADAFLERDKPLGWARNPLNASRDAACNQTLLDLRRDGLCEEVAKVGSPPWDAAKAMQVASLRATLDFESLPKGQQTASLNGQAGVTTSLWINQAGGGGAKQKTFIFKPQMEDEVNGFPPGGEPVREAMVGRAADLLNGLGFGIAMPETHVIALSPDRIPPEASAEITRKALQKTGPLVGSLQSFSDATGDLKQASRQAMRSVPAKAVHSLAVMDIISLNCDRHGGNLLTTGGNPPSIVPIDHGLAFPPATQLAQLNEKMAGAHNAMLALPASHVAFDAEVLAKIAELDPEVFAGALRRELTALDTAQPALAGTLDTTAIDVSKRSMQFLKRAAPTLTPAAVQLAIGRNAAALLDPTLDQTAFETLADAIIQKTAPEQGAISEYFQMTAEQKAAVFQRLKQNGWDDEIGFNQPDGPLMSDLAALMKLYHSNVMKLTPQPATPVANVRVTPQQLDEIRAQFPGTLLRNPVQEQEAVVAMGKFRALNSTMDQMTTFLRDNALNPLDLRSTLRDVNKVMKFHQQATNMATVVAVTPPPTRRQAMQTKLTYLDQLIAMLPANADPDIALTAGRVRAGIQLRTMPDDRMNDLGSALSASIDSAYDSVRNRLHRILAALVIAGLIDEPTKKTRETDINEGNLISVFNEFRSLNQNLGGA